MKNFPIPTAIIGFYGLNNPLVKNSVLFQKKLLFTLHKVFSSRKRRVGYMEEKKNQEFISISWAEASKRSLPFTRMLEGRALREKTKSKVSRALVHSFVPPSLAIFSLFTSKALFWPIRTSDL